MFQAGALEIINLSDRGRRRPNNEDSTASDAHLGLAVVADGMGGYRSGEVASAIAVSSVMNDLRNALTSARLSGRHHAVSKQSSIVNQAITHANSMIYRTGQTEPQCQGMGTTVVACLFQGNNVTVGHVGDSRLYRLRGGAFDQITTDHSVVQELIDQAGMTAEQAAAAAPKNLVTRALGIDEAVQVDIYEESLDPGDIYVLCTDGLHDMVNNEEIHLTLREYNDNLVGAGDRLVALANERGGHDNISLVIARLRAYRRAIFVWPRKLQRWVS